MTNLEGKTKEFLRAEITRKHKFIRVRNTIASFPQTYWPFLGGQKSRF